MKLKKQLSNETLLAVSIGLVYLWFGLLKFFSGLSPAEDLAVNTISFLTINLIPNSISILLLAVLECVIGLGLIIKLIRKPFVLLALGHILLTFVPLFIFPELAFKNHVYAYTLLGQYIFKNIVFVSALIVIYRELDTKKKLDKA